jgi:hypothetical protein
MAIGQNGKEEFRDAIVEFRNLDIENGLTPLFEFREQLIGNDDLSDRSGIDDTTRDHFLQHLLRCDEVRRRVTYNPEGGDVGTELAKAIDPNAQIDLGAKPFAGEMVQGPSGGLIQLPWDLTGEDPNTPLRSQLDIRNGFAKSVLTVIDLAIVTWTRLESRVNTQFITRNDSVRVYQLYQRIYAILMTFGGSDQRVDIAQGVRASEEPRGPDNSANRKTETASGGTATG